MRFDDSTEDEKTERFLGRRNGPSPPIQKDSMTLQKMRRLSFFILDEKDEDQAEKLTRNDATKNLIRYPKI